LKHLVNSNRVLYFVTVLNEYLNLRIFDEILRSGSLNLRLTHFFPTLSSISDNVTFVPFLLFMPSNGKRT